MENEIILHQDFDFQELRERVMCPICMDNVLNMVFLCGHGVCQVYKYNNKDFFSKFYLDVWRSLLRGLKSLPHLPKTD